ncbi:OLC1v1009850C1 [Oldenlandia corymbosa var. corymbosa]|uniref:OLC1v1009850C1 n=1 Tax=Oldenlandia corymbosa var. corymbosa TaxID=529605 RepID=A0AAV1DSC1_OLDCO|nr:OLC1v1009850C1 [Oldenlandia corymbosa var. corymbosa]
MLPLLIFFFFFPSSSVDSYTYSNGTTPQDAASLPFPAMYVLGDSLVDSGNNNFLPTLAKANFFPYGSDFPRGPTGRFTNGRTVVDFIAEFLGLPYVPPYASLMREASMGGNQASGLNYASASCGILTDTGKNLGGCMALAEQINLLLLTINVELPRYFPTKADISNHLSKSLFVISVGSNDYLVNYLRPFSPTRALYPPRVFARLLVISLCQQIQRLYQMGARKLLLFEIGPIGCIPSIRKYSYLLNNKGFCVEEVNRFAAIYNYQLHNMIQYLRLSLPDATLIVGRVFNAAYDAILNPSSYGFSDASEACCMTWANGTSACIPGFPPCGDPFQHYFWDGFHLTEAVYRLVAEDCINGSSICNPNISELVDSLQ